MLQFFKDVRVDWLANRRLFIIISILLMLIGLVSAIVRQAVPGGTEAFNLGVDFKGGTVITARFLKQRPSDETIRAEFAKQGVGDAIIQPTDKPDIVLIKVPRQAVASAETTNAPAQPTPAQPTGGQPPAQPGQPAQAGQSQAKEAQAQVDPGVLKVKQALDTFGAKDDVYKIESTEAVGEIAGKQLRTQAIAVTLAALVGILLYIAFRFELSYGAAAVIAVFHDVLVTLGIFSIFQWEISLTVIAALLTLVGFSVNDTIVVFDRIRENLRLHRRDSLYKVTNDSINQTLSRTVITSGLVFLSVLAMVLFGGEVLRGFSLALLIGILFGTYSSIAIASPIMVWWQQRLDASQTRSTPIKESGAAAAGGRTRARKAAAGGSLKETQGAARS
ncbi:MAG: preprotein translocase subunit SecF [Blastocatellia bacterium]|jgi:preprotein translocase subunit SecF|nr:preprotein translocase subunit SecF [Blastocatellia bacterium]